MAQQRDGVFTWMHADHLSSTTRITDAADLEVRRVAYKSFGEEAENQCSSEDPKYTYTGKEQDSSGLYYFGARYYDPALARFISADTVYDAGPQGLNRYSYALNNPIIYRDPTGHFINGPDDDPNPTCDGCVTGPNHIDKDEHGHDVDEMVYHDNAWDPSSAHHHAPHRFRHGGIGAHRVGKITPAGVFTWIPGHRRTEMLADDSSPIPYWLATKIGNILGTFSRECVNPFTGRPVPYSVREQVIGTSSQLAVSGVVKLTGFSAAVPGATDDLLGVADDVDTIQVYNSGEITGVTEQITLEQARKAAIRNGIDMRAIELSYEAGHSSTRFGFSSQTGTGTLIRVENGRYLVTLTDAGLSNERAAVNTIAHELNHIREIRRLGPGHFIDDETAADFAGDMAELFFK